MASLNKLQIIGNLGNDPEVKYTSAGMAITNISVATTEKWKDQAGNPKEETEWHRVVFFGKLAEIAGEYLRKGSSVYVEGRLKTEKWQDQNGVDRYTTKVIAGEMKMLGGRPANDNGQAPQQRQQRPAQGGTSQPGRNTAPPAPPMNDFADDDIPF